MGGVEGGGPRRGDRWRLPLNKTVDQTYREGSVTDWMRANRKGGELREKKCATTSQSDEKAL